jgi:phospho-N-acetylmuramoyl-pentapeptide-transferase
MIRKLREFQVGQVIRQEGPATTGQGRHADDGRLLILTAVLVPTLLWANLTNVTSGSPCSRRPAFGADRLRRRLPEDRPPRRTTGCCPATRWAQVVVALAVGRCAARAGRAGALYSTRLIFPFFKRLIPTSAGSTSVRVLVLVGASNAVNLTDGLDGLAISVFAVAAAAFTALAYVTGHRVFAEYLLLVRFAPAAAELTSSAARWSARASASSGTTRTPPRSSWATSGRSRSAARSARWRSSSSRSCCS